MIETKQDLKNYLIEDQKANFIACKKIKRHFGHGNVTMRYTYRMRHAEYFLNKWKKASGIKRCVFFLLYKFNKLKLNRLSIKLGIFINLNSFGPGLRIAHPFCVYVGKNVNVGKNCFIHQCVTIGMNENEEGYPSIGDNAVIGAGAKIIGNVKIADNVCIGANAVVVSNIDEPNTTWAGVPAKKISANSSLSYLSPYLDILSK